MTDISDDAVPQDPIAAIRRALDTVRFAEIAREEAKRTVFCRPEDADRMRWLIDQHGLEDVLTLIESSFVTEGQAYVADTNAIDAGTAEAIQSMNRRWFS